ncbi:Zinc finger protein 423 [Amphibalanus amphitrite]|uniref:Zinc finger protein 423 n=1 Tax=Amphibalanus amphitrite TaxID=1232801 RepID=A0A6A4VNE0_AMPAM|nr:Zinc finger protein 423 [Amphibalanus amphitrite]
MRRGLLVSLQYWPSEFLFGVGNVVGLGWTLPSFPLCPCSGPVDGLTTLPLCSAYSEPVHGLTPSVLSTADLSTDSQSISSEVSLTSGSPGSSAELDSLVTIGATEATPYKCCFCEQAYPRQTLMKLHEQTHTDQLPFECEYCGHRFKHKRSKDRHVKLHTGEKKFKCKYCPSAYCRSDHLKIHMRTHDSQKPYQCSVCNRGYRTAAALTSHLQKHKDREAAAAAAAAGDRQPQPYRCLKCAATYPSGEALQVSSCQLTEMRAVI